MKLTELKPAPGSRHRPKRVGRGNSSGHGKTSCRGNNGQGQRSGTEFKRGFEGGQMPLYRRLPKKKHFKVINKENYLIVNLKRLNVFENNTEVTPEVLLKAGIIPNTKDKIKILGDGELNKVLTIYAHKVSEQAKEKIESSGSTIKIIEAKA